MFVNVEALDEVLSKRNFTKVAFAAALGINLSTLYRKIKSPEGFTVGEMHKTIEVLRLSKKETEVIFLASNSQN